MSRSSRKLRNHSGQGWSGSLELTIAPQKGPRAGNGHSSWTPKRSSLTTTSELREDSRGGKAAHNNSKSRGTTSREENVSELRSGDAGGYQGRGRNELIKLLVVLCSRARAMLLMDMLTREKKAEQKLRSSWEDRELERYP
ncbi:hypothetical protein CDL15_Pgr012712 [Punica granatum]|uniref:Uncharacterized protein n=1 Tax=Punica granatum TaxID=22663 RepID=A0A218XFH1_PUNGR|nr:hypothetical protein CDL15_Pgr012712 [Punica granatum]